MGQFTLKVAITGGPGSGKRTFKRKLDTCVLRRNRNTFCFSGHILGASEQSDVDFSVALIDPSEVFRSVRPYVLRACDLATTTRTCIVGTKRDTVPYDYCDADLNARAHPTCTAYYHMVRYFSVNCLSGQGIKSLCEHIIDVMTLPSGGTERIAGSTLFSNKIMTRLLDSIAAMFTLPVPKNVNRDTPDREEFDDNSINALLSSPLAIAWDRSLKERAHSTDKCMPTHQISPSLIVKANSPHERAAMSFIRRHTRIPVPQPRHHHLRQWLVSDFIEGEMLLECWEKRSILMKFRIACTIRGYLAQLSRLRSTMPGRLEDNVVDGRLFEHEAHGPFESASHFQTWCEMIAMTGWCSTAAHLRRLGRLEQLMPSPITGDPWDLVFAHGDLNLSNFLLSKDGVLWIIDWHDSGFYPPWFDGVSMASYDEAPRSWRLLRPFITGKDHRYDNFWTCFLIDFHRFHNSEAYDG